MSPVPPSEIISEEARDLFGHMAATGAQPRPADDRATCQLLSLGLIREDPGLGYALVDPQYVGARWEGSFYSSAALMLQQAATVSDALRDLRQAFDHRTVDSAGLIEYHRGSEAINWRLGQILGGCSNELLLCQPGGPRSPEGLQEAAPRDLAALRRGVRMCTLYHEHARAGAAMDSWVKSMTAAGAEIRTVDEDFERMIIIDRQIAVIPVDRILLDSSETVAYVVNDAGVAGFLARQFERDWSRAAPWEGEGGDLPLTGRQLTILRGLARGESQQQIARRLKIGQRTMADAIAELKVLFGASTLFQLACEWQTRCC